MLILTRRLGERLVISQDSKIIIAVLGIKSNQVRIGIEAPKKIPVHREEIFNLIHSNENVSIAHHKI